MLYKKSELTNALFIRISTELIKPNFNDLPVHMQKVWGDRMHSRYKNSGPYSDVNAETTYGSFAQYHAEFSRITSIAVGTIDAKLNKSIINVADASEVVLLNLFESILTKGLHMVLAGHNVINYQIPFIIKRMLVHNIKLPFQLQLKNKKPWDQVTHDIMRDWQGNAYGDMDVSAMAYALGINFNELKYDSDKVGEAEMDAVLEMFLKLSA